MSRFEALTHNLRESFDSLSEGWQELWHKARNAVTRFTPLKDEDENSVPIMHHSSRWGLMSAEMRETDETVEVQFEAPGMDKKDFEIEIDGRYLSIRGRKHYRSDRHEGRFHITERAYGSFERLLPLPCEVREGTARYEDGVLTVSLPKTEADKTQRIAVH